jgi:ribosome biogenesis GTPase
LLAAGCRFRDCTHKGEPGCAVLSAVERGALDEARLRNYDKMTQEIAHLERKQDRRAALENKRRWKQMHKAARKLPYRW